MNPDRHAIDRLKRANRQLKVGCLLVAGVGLVSHLLVQPDTTHAIHADSDRDRASIYGNQVGDAQFVVGIDHPDGFAVIVDEKGQVNVVTKDGAVLVNRQKRYTN